MSALIPIDDRFGRLVDALDEPAERASLESLLPGYIRAQRWFGGATRAISITGITAWIDLGLEEDAALCIVKATDSAGYETTHQLYLGIVDDDSGPPAIFDALERPSVREFLAAIALEGRSLAGHEVSLVGEPASPVTAVRSLEESRVIDAEQTNTTLVYGDVCIAKVYRHLRGGANPDVELLRALAAAGFESVPEYLGRAIISAPGGLHADAVLVERFVHNEGDGWDWAVRNARAEMAGAESESDLVTRMAQDGLLIRASDMGVLTARLHAALASLTGNDFAAAEAGSASVEAAVASVREEAIRTREMMHQAAFTAPGLADAVDRLEAASSRPVSDAGRLMRVHGDYHLGQLLVDATGFTVIDFEGEPARPLDERRALQHPLTDVAGMLRSFDYAAQTARREASAAPPIAAAWEAAMRSHFLDGYWLEAEATAPSSLPALPADRNWLLAVFEVRKALYELRYELEFRPTWAEIPAATIPRLGGRL